MHIKTNEILVDQNIGNVLTSAGQQIAMIWWWRSLVWGAHLIQNVCMEIITATDHWPSSHKPQFSELYTKRMHFSKYRKIKINSFSHIVNACANSDKLWIFYLFYSFFFLLSFRHAFVGKPNLKFAH